MRFPNNFWKNISARDAFPFVCFSLRADFNLDLTFRTYSYVSTNVIISYTIALRKPQQRAVCRASRNSATSLNVDTSPGEELKTSLISGRSNRGMPLELRG